METLETDLWKHINSENGLVNVRGLQAKLVSSGSQQSLHITKELNNNDHYSWLCVSPPANDWKLNTANYVNAVIKNTGKDPIEVILWVTARCGWHAVADTATLSPGETHRFSCNLWETFPDNTPKLNPNYITQIQVMFVDAKPNPSARLMSLTATGNASEWVRLKGRIDVPEMTIGNPKAGQRTLYKVNDMIDSKLYCSLYLPTNWKPGKKSPVIVEYPGNIFFTRTVYSPGRPEQCVIGYGMTKGKNAIWLCLPFVDYTTGEIVEDGWGDPDNTAIYAQRAINEVVDKFGGDRKNIVLTGFSRGAIACGFIGLRNDSIAAFWKGFHLCQHYDGVGWKGSNMKGALGRIKRLGSRQIFLTDNNAIELKNMLLIVNANATFVNSGLKNHSCDMFLDNRLSTLQLREWYTKLINR